MKNFIGLGSGQGTNLLKLYEGQKGYRIGAIFTDRVCPLLSSFQKRDVPCFSFTDSFEEKALQKIRSLPFATDFLFLGGFMRILKGPLLQAFENRIINVHPGDLSLLGRDDKRILTGKYAPLKAVLLGRKELKSSVHLVDEGVDAGKVLEISSPLDIPYPEKIRKLTRSLKIENTASALDAWIAENAQTELFRSLKNFATLLQEKQKEVCDHPVFLKVAQNIAEGTLL